MFKGPMQKCHFLAQIFFFFFLTCDMLTPVPPSWGWTVSELAVCHQIFVSSLHMPRTKQYAYVHIALAFVFVSSASKLVAALGRQAWSPVVEGIGFKFEKFPYVHTVIKCLPLYLLRL